MVKEQKSERGIEHWNKLGEKTGGLKSFGLGLTQLRKLAKQIGRDSSLATKLWNSDVYELKVLSLLGSV
jgi:3-methyladenine DNA glycosylase AlkD